MEPVGGASLGVCKRYLEGAPESNPKRRRILPTKLFEETLSDYSQSFQNQPGWIDQEKEYTVVHAFCPPEQPLESNSNENAIPTSYSSQLLRELQNPTREVQSIYPLKELLEDNLEAPYATSSSINSSEEYNQNSSEYLKWFQKPIDEVDQQIFPKNHLEAHAAKRTRDNQKQVLIEAFSKLPEKFQKLPAEGVDRERLGVILDTFRFICFYAEAVFTKSLNIQYLKDIMNEKWQQVDHLFPGNSPKELPYKELPYTVTLMRLGVILNTFRLICLYAEAVVTRDLNTQHLKDIMNEKWQQVGHFFPGRSPEEQPYIDFIATLISTVDAFIDHIIQNKLDDIDDLLSQLHISKG